MRGNPPHKTESSYVKFINKEALVRACSASCILISSVVNDFITSLS